jgi:hypothetical protein
MSTSGNTTPTAAVPTQGVRVLPQPPEALVLSPKDTEHATTRQGSSERLNTAQPTAQGSSNTAPVLTSSPTTMTSPSAAFSSTAMTGAHARPERRASLTPPTSAQHGIVTVPEFDLESGRYPGATGTPSRTQSHTGGSYNRRRTNPPPAIPIMGIPGEGGAPGDGGDGGADTSWIAPIGSEKTAIIVRRLTIRERLQPTLERAQTERNKYANKARYTGYALNAAIGAQVVLGTLTTGLSAALSGKSVRTTIPAFLLPFHFIWLMGIPVLCADLLSHSFPRRNVNRGSILPRPR